MFALALLTFIVLRAFSAQAKVVDSFEECKGFFYKNTEPKGMDQNAMKICQKYGVGGPYYYATLYSVHHRIPLYSAYTLDPICSSTPGVNCGDNWHVEPQISQPDSQPDYMVLEKDSDINIIKGNQAISGDYSTSGYDRGHLNPNSFQNGEGHTATCTLTNAAPMAASFNRIHWKNWESTLRSLLKDNLNRDGASATVYIVTGTVPGANERIPHRETPGDSERVTVPSHIWTAVCYSHSTNDEKSFSFGFMGRNQPEEPGINLMRVSILNDRLRELYSGVVTIFADDCGDDNNKLNMIQESFQKLINLPVNQGVQKSPDAQNMRGVLKRTLSSDSTSSVTEEELKAFSGSACLITHAKPLVINDELRKREVSTGSDDIECQLVPEKQKTAADGSFCSSVSDSAESCQCTTGGETKPCYSSPCMNPPCFCNCNSRSTQIPCSPPYSVITYKGARCLDDYPCAIYSQNYYWCWTGNLLHQWNYCSPPLWCSKAKNGKYCRINNACAKYGSRYKWCYTDDKNNWDTCCTTDDCYSAVNDKTCRSDHTCGYHGYNYLWCYTTKGSWDYCCTDCGQ